MDKIELFSKNLFTLKIGKIIELKDNNLCSVEIMGEYGSFVLEEARAMSSSKVKYSPTLGSEVLVGFLSNAVSSPIILGEFALSSKDMVEVLTLLKIDEKACKVYIGNGDSSLKEILSSLSSLLGTVSTALEGAGIVTDLRVRILELNLKIENLLT